jgi:hypothetical protein
VEPSNTQPIDSVVPSWDETADLLRRQVEVQRQLLQLSKECGIAFYRPHYYQDLYHTCSFKRRGLFAGNRLGKSEGNAAETVAWMMGERVWYKTAFDVLRVIHQHGTNRHNTITRHHEGGENHPLVRQSIPPWPTKQVIVCTNWDKVDEIWTNQSLDRPGKIWKLLPKGFGRGSRNHEGVISEIYGANGSLIKFVSVDAFRRNPLVAESSDWDRVSFDEPGPEDLWKGLSRGLVDRHGQGDFTLTSLQEMWIYDYFYSDENTNKENRIAWRAEIYDNPFLTNESIKAFADDLTEDERTCRLEGLPLELSGLVYKEFKREQHVLKDLPPGWKDWHLPSHDCVLYARADVHSVTPNAVLFAAVDKSGIPVLCHEIWRSSNADDLADEINEYVKLTGCFLANVKMDPSGWIQDMSTRAASIARTFAAHGLFCGKASKDFTNGILKTRSALKQNQLFFAPTLRRTLWEISRYAFDPKTGKPYDKDDHLMENLRRLCIDSCPWFDPDKAAGFPITDQEFITADLTLNV